MSDSLRLENKKANPNGLAFSCDPNERCFELFGGGFAVNQEEVYLILQLWIFAVVSFFVPLGVSVPLFFSY